VKEFISNQNSVKNANYRNHYNATSGIVNKDVHSIAQGLEDELEKIVNNCIVKQYSYGKEISLDRLSLRLSSYSAESYIMNYTSQFDRGVLASDYANILYIVKDSSAYYTSFKDLQHLQKKLAPAIQHIQYKKQQLLQSGKVEESNTPALKETKETGKDVRKCPRRKSASYRKQVLGTLLYDQNASLKAAEKALNTSHIRGRKESLSVQLGIYNSILEEDLKTDFSLNPQSTASTLTTSSSSTPASYAYAAFPYNEDTFTLSDHEYTGFVQLAPDLYSRSTNPHLQLNEIGVMRLRASLKRHELAHLADISSY
jgi:hypothetical protein